MDLRRIVQANQQGTLPPADLLARAHQIEADMTTPAPSNLAERASKDLVALTERQIGLTFPNLLRRLYSEVADGGFGPSDGLLSLKGVTKLYAELKDGDLLPRNREWPAHLLPIVQESQAIVCVDLTMEDGRVIVLDQEELDEYMSASEWGRAFKEEASSLVAWLTEWLDGPSPEQQAAVAVADELLSDIQQARASRAMIAKMSPEERAAMGLPEVGWEEVVWGGLGWDPNEEASRA
jgi:hypothetical protein